MGAARPNGHTLGAYYGTNGRAFELQSRTRFTASTAPAPLEVDLPAATPITGSLPALAKRHLYLANLEGDEVGETKADASGAFRFDVVPGHYRVEVDRDATYLDYRSPSCSRFQANSPYFLTWPAGWVTLRAGRATAVGTVALRLEG